MSEPILPISHLEILLFEFFFGFSLTRPISPICQSPFFPDLTFKVSRRRCAMSEGGPSAQPMSRHTRASRGTRSSIILYSSDALQRHSRRRETHCSNSLRDRTPSMSPRMRRSKRPSPAPSAAASARAAAGSRLRRRPSGSRDRRSRDRRSSDSRSHSSTRHPATRASGRRPSRYHPSAQRRPSRWRSRQQLGRRPHRPRGHPSPMHRRRQPRRQPRLCGRPLLQAGRRGEGKTLVRAAPDPGHCAQPGTSALTSSAVGDSHGACSDANIYIYMYIYDRVYLYIYIDIRIRYCCFVLNC